jgi:hypothetical protein
MNNFVGIPYGELDCYQLVRKASYVLYAKALPNIQDYAMQPAETIEEYKASRQWKELPGPELGCVVVLGQTQMYAKHVGIWVGPGVLHSTRKYGAVIQDEYQLLASGYSSLRYYKWEG